MKNLEGLKVVITRPQKQAESIIHALQNAGATVEHIPLLEIVPIGDQDADQDQVTSAIKAKILQLDRYDMAIFISSNAAAIGLQWMQNYWPQMPQGLEFAAIGPSTAGILQQQGLQVIYPQEGGRSENLLQFARFQQLSNQRILIFRGVGGRELLADSLRQRGAEVDYVELYRRRVPGYAKDYLPTALQQANPDVIVLSSGEGLENLLLLLGDNKSQVCLVPLLVPSERVKQWALEAGFETVINSNGAADQAIMQSLKSLGPVNK